MGHCEVIGHSTPRSAGWGSEPGSPLCAVERDFSLGVREAQLSPSEPESCSPVWGLFKDPGIIGGEDMGDCPVV